MPIANLANAVVIIVGLVLLFFIRGRVGRAHYGLGDRVEKRAALVDAGLCALRYETRRESRRR